MRLSVAALPLLVHLLDLSHSLVDHLKLIAPISCVDHWALVQACVLASLRVVVEDGSHSRHFGSIHGIMLEEDLDLLGKSLRVFVYSLAVNVVEHGYWAQLVDSSQLSKHGNFVVR